MEEWKKKLEKLEAKCFEGEVTVPKPELWLVLTACFLMGILYGLKKAAMTHEVILKCDDGDSCSCSKDCKGTAKAEKAKEEYESCRKEACGDSRQSDEKHKCHKKSRCCGKNR